MKYRKAAFALALLGLAACGPAQSDGPLLGNMIGKIGDRDRDAIEFHTPGGAHCIYVAGYKSGALSCKFP